MMTKNNIEGGNERKSNAGRKSKYHTHIEPYLEAIKAMMRAGATLDIIGQKFGVSHESINQYKNKFPEFAEALKENGEIADFTIESALYNMAKTDKVAAFFWLKNRQAKRWRDKQHVFQASTVNVRKDYDHMSDEELEAEMDALEGIVPGAELDYESEGEVH